MSASRHRGLQRTLSNSGYRALVDWVDWDKMPARSAFKVFGLGLLAMIPFVALMALASWMGIQPPPGADFAVLLGFQALIAVPTLGALWLGLQAIRSARAESSKFPEFALFSSRKPVIYLREFHGENATLAESFAQREGQAWGAVASAVFVVADSSFERQIAKGTASIGQLVALGDPLDRRKPGEARRVRIKGPDWQAAVDVLLKRASLAVLLYSPKETVSWEAQRVIEESTIPVFVWMPQLLTPEQFEAGVSLESVLPEWLRRPLRAQLSTGDHITDPRSSYLCYFDERRVLTIKRIRSWATLARGMKQLLKHARYKGQPNGERKFFWSIAEPLERLYWRLPYVLGFILLGAVIYLSNPLLRSGLECSRDMMSEACVPYWESRGLRAPGTLD